MEMKRREAVKTDRRNNRRITLANRCQAQSQSSMMISRTIPSSGEKLPVIGLGTWSVLTSILRQRTGRNWRSARCWLSAAGAWSFLAHAAAPRVVGRAGRPIAFARFALYRHQGLDKRQRSRARDDAAFMVRFRKIDLMQVHNLSRCGNADVFTS